MSGNKKGTYGFILEQNENVFFAGCPIHLLHIAAKKAAQMLPTGIEEALTDVYYYLKCSAKRKTELREMQGKYGLQNLKVLKHVPTRWLSLGNCLRRLLVLRDPLKKFFSEEMKKDLSKQKKTQQNRPMRVDTFLNSYTSIAYCHFLCYALEVFDKYNTALQGEKPMIQSCQRMLLELYRALLSKYMIAARF
jgi:hypothetical protein